MRCEVRLFAQAKELAGSDRLVLNLPDGAVVGDALNAILKKHPSLASLKGRLAVAIDHRYASPHTPLRDGSTIALIPPVSGG